MAKKILLLSLVGALLNSAYGMSIQDALRRFELSGDYKLMSISQNSDIIIFVNSKSIKKSAYACNTTDNYKQVWSYALIQSKKELASSLYIINCSKNEYAIQTLKIADNYGDSILNEVSYPDSCLPKNEFYSIDPMSLMYDEATYVCSYKAS